MDLPTVTRVQATHASSPDDEPAQAKRGLRIVAGTIAGLGAAIGMYAALASGRLPGVCGPLLLLALLAAVPSAVSLARRVAVNAAVFIGWSPLSWWERWPVSFNHGALVIAVAFGGLVTLVAAARSPRTALTRLVPSTKPVDALIPAGGLLAFAAMTRWALPGTPKNALMLLLPGADNYPHFHMFQGIRTNGATLYALGAAPDGSLWAFYNYPQGFHGLAAAMSELLLPKLPRGSEMLVAYTQSVATVIILATIMMTAATVSIPALRSRFSIALPTVVVTWAAYLWQPGQQVLVDGFANFWLGAAAAGTALVLAAGSSTRFARGDLVAIGGLLIAVTHTWAPLLVFALPACAVLLASNRSPDREGSHPRRLAWFVVAVGLATSAAVSAGVVLLLRTVPMSVVVRAVGGLHGTSPLPTFAMLTASLVCCLWYPSASRRRRIVRHDAALMTMRLRLLAVTPLTGLLVLATFLVVQLHLLGTSAYYFIKYVVGFELVMAVLAPAMCGIVLAQLLPRHSRRAGLTYMVTASLLATQAFGRFPHGTMPLFSKSGEGTASLDAPLSVSRIAGGILAAARGTKAERTFQIEYFPLGPARASNPFYGDAWFHAVQDSLSLTVFNRYAPWRVGSKGIDEAAPLISVVLRKDPDVRVVVDPQFVQPLRDRLGSRDLALRVIGWR